MLQVSRQAHLLPQMAQAGKLRPLSSRGLMTLKPPAPQPGSSSCSKGVLSSSKRSASLQVALARAVFAQASCPNSTCLLLMHVAQALAASLAFPLCIHLAYLCTCCILLTVHSPCMHLAYTYLGKRHVPQVMQQGLSIQSGCRPMHWFTYGSVVLQAAVSALPVAQPFTMGTSSPPQEPLLHEGSAPRRKSLARLGPPLPRRRSSDENADTRSVSEFEWDASSRADMSIVSRAASSRSRRSSVSISEHAMPQVCHICHAATLGCQAVACK